jgi:hypothetical protein
LSGIQGSFELRESFSWREWDLCEPGSNAQEWREH